MPSAEPEQRLDPRKVLVGKIVHQLILRGWRPPRQMPDPALGSLLEAIRTVGSHGETLNLAPSEVRVMRLTAEGYTATKIAKELRVQPQTVKSQQRVARRKLGARNTLHAVVIAMREGVI
jgi:DNA-binding CsgD family transcriptional regulator